MSSNYLFELGTEELPPKALSTLSQALEVSVTNSLKEHGLKFKQFASFCTPRRLAFLINGLDDATAVQENKVWGPPAKIAFDADGNASKAALAFCKRNNVDVSEIKTESDGKVEKIVVLVNQGGESTSSLLPDFIQKALSALPIPKRMHWGASRIEFVRPVHWLILLKNSDVIDCTLLGLNSDRVSRGHRFLSNEPISINEAITYEQQLLTEGKVVASFTKRQESIVEQVENAAKAISGKAVIEADLLDEVTGLVEWPVALAGNFDKAFLSVPSEALISSMKEHQKYFHLVDSNGELLANFITVSNIEANDYSAIINGNEKVIRPRLADAAFFYETDKKTSLDSRREKLKTVVFQHQLGSIFDKTERIQILAKYICEQLSIDNSESLRVAQLCKSDLVSNMVYEFPEMQGIAGFHYALNDAESQAIADGIVEHYLPKFAGDALPKSTAGAVVALADRIDTITGIFGIGEIPTGSKDPFALRRASVGVLRLLIELNHALDLKPLVACAVSAYGNLPKADETVDNVLSYVFERFRAWYEDTGIATEVFQSVHCKGLSNPVDIHSRVQAVAAFYSLPEASALAAANKRVANILNKLDKAPESAIDSALLHISAEQNLAALLPTITETISPLVAEQQYEAALKHLASLRQPVDAFFDDVMVMDEDKKLQANRLAILSQLRDLFLDIADISFLAPAKK